ncbi:MAG: type II secretion system protein G [Hydrogenophaga sp.]|uniref:type II secretion system protein G n=1 Tax=Hydrogenophaga sp. TaxID=1904254 RepID=UPI002AB99E7A|nr:type II secretion system protein G [Hydrogenophaga sp.]MDZ4101274.1 type II secretion system protein G [Hydrogenophaga sp.]
MFSVLAIVSTLLLLVAPRYFQRVDVAQEAVLRDNLRTLRQVLDNFHGDHGRFPDSLQELVDKRYVRSLPVDPLTGSTETWTLLPPPDGLEGAVYDLRSGAAGTAKDGSLYADW